MLSLRRGHARRFNTGAPSPLGDQPKVFDQLAYTGSGPGSGYNPLYPFTYGLPLAMPGVVTALIFTFIAAGTSERRVVGGLTTRSVK